jgi:hypothetical protein
VLSELFVGYVTLEDKATTRSQIIGQQRRCVVARCARRMKIQLSYTTIGAVVLGLDQVWQEQTCEGRIAGGFVPIDPPSC